MFSYMASLIKINQTFHVRVHSALRRGLQCCGQDKHGRKYTVLEHIASKRLLSKDDHKYLSRTSASWNVCNMYFFPFQTCSLIFERLITVKLHRMYGGKRTTLLVNKLAGWLIG